MKKLLVIALYFFFFTLSSAQTLTDSLEYGIISTPFSLLTTVFDKQINTYNLNSGLRLNSNIDRTNIRVFENYASTFINSTEKSIRDEQFLNLSLAYKVNDYLSAGFLGTSSILSDNRRIEINQASVNNASLFLSINPYDSLYITPFGGYSNNRQIGENDYGFIYGAEGSLNDLDLSGLYLRSDFKYKNEDISPRKNTLRYFRTEAINQFSDDVSNDILFRFTQSRKDFYYQADSLTAREFDIANNIQSRTETSYYIQNALLSQNFLSLFSQEIYGRVAWRNIDRDTRYRLTNTTSSSIFDTEINELRFEFESNTYYRSKFFDGGMKIFFSERDEKHLTKRFEGAGNIFYDERSELESSKNNNSIRASVSIIGNFNFSSTDKLSFSLFQNKLRYDTPSENNFDDRDELLSIVRLGYSKMLTPFMEAFVNLEGTYNHIVYIYAERSSNNNVNRILRLSSGGSYRGKNVTSVNNFEVSANYSVYDFEDLNPVYRSFSFRQFTATDSSYIKLTRLFSFGIYGYVKLSEQGDLRWASFATHPTRFLEEIYAEPKLIINYSKLMLSLGMRVFSLNTYNFSGREKVLDSEYLSTGPLAEVLVSLQDALYIRFYGWYEFITIRNNPGKEQVNFNLQMNWNF